MSQQSLQKINDALNQLFTELVNKAKATADSFVQSSKLYAESENTKCYYFPRVQVSGASLSIVWYQRHPSWGSLRRNIAATSESLPRLKPYRYSDKQFKAAGAFFVACIHDAEDSFEAIRKEAEQLQLMRRQLRLLAATECVVNQILTGDTVEEFQIKAP